jgi:signal transduction histidine kinase
MMRSAILSSSQFQLHGAALPDRASAMPISSAAFVRTTLALLFVGFAAVFGIVAASVWLAGYTDSRIAILDDEQRIRREVFILIALIQNAEAGQRGYLLTREEPYLAPYQDAVRSIDGVVDSLHALVEDRPNYARAVNQLGRLVADKLTELEETIELMRAGRTGEAMAIIRSDRGKIAMDALRAAAAALVTSTDAVITATALDLRSSANALVIVLSAGGLVTLFVVGGTGWVAWRHTRDLEASRREVLALNTTLEARVRARTEDVARANEEIQRFAYIVSHDLRSPLVNVMGFTSELEAGVATIREYVGGRDDDPDDQLLQAARQAIDSDMPEAIGFIRSSTAKMDNLINAILRLSREGRRSLTAEPIDMRALLVAAADSVRHRIAETGGEIEVGRAIPEIISDRLAVEQIFGNLIDNAVKYLVPDRPGRVVVSAEETPMGIDFIVEDNGRGIAAEDQERVFELFRRAGPQDQPGEGIGLSHVRALVRRLGGTISLRSEVGKGTAFRVRLPRTLPQLRESV